MMAAVLDEVAARRIQELEITLAATERRVFEQDRHISLLNTENDRLRDEVQELRTEAQTLLLKLAGRVPVEDEA